MPASQAETALKERLAEELGSAPAEQLVVRLAVMGGKPEPVAATA